MESIHATQHTQTPTCTHARVLAVYTRLITQKRPNTSNYGTFGLRSLFYRNKKDGMLSILCIPNLLSASINLYEIWYMQYVTALSPPQQRTSQNISSVCESIRVPQTLIDNSWIKIITPSLLGNGQAKIKVTAPTNTHATTELLNVVVFYVVRAV